MVFIIGLLTAVLVLDCILLVLLVLMQLPKKEAGAGLAFGGAATDALFGAGSGNFLTKTTKYAAVAFFAIAIVLSITHSRYMNRPDSALRRQWEQANDGSAADACHGGDNRHHADGSPPAPVGRGNPGHERRWHERADDGRGHQFIPGVMGYVLNPGCIPWFNSVARTSSHFGP